MIPIYRMQYSKEGTARYISHLDLLRAFERAGRRAGLPLAFTRGFNPHPIISFAAPLGVGIAGEVEYVDLELTADITAGEVLKALSSTLPEGIQLLEVRMISEHSPGLMAGVERATYRAVAKLKCQLDQKKIDESIATFLDRTEVWVERKNKAGGKMKFNIRPGIFDMSGRSESGKIIINVELKAGSRGNIRIEEVIEAFQTVNPLPLAERFILNRTGLFTMDGQIKKTLW
ncbi:MAG: TIGR03936 family radical SAM-associated protein [Desulfotomaculaceae bacterium]|nr:TIGR03936 family radical SAM-associated protein [Desulfotomaculaceae bacterium]